MKKIIIIVSMVLAAVVGLSYLFGAANVATAPSRVISHATTTENIIGNYEAFFDMKASYDARLAQVKALSGQLEHATGDDRRYAQTDLNGSQQACRQIAQRYNGDSQKLNRAAFKSAGLPETLDATACEG